MNKLALFGRLAVSGHNARSLDIFNALASRRLSKMKNNYLHTGNTTKKSSARARAAVFRAFGVVAAVILAGVALPAGPEHPSVRSSKSQIVAENPDASKNPIAEKADTLVMRVYFRDRSERDRLAQTQRRRGAYNRRLSHRHPRSRPRR